MAEHNGDEFHILLRRFREAAGLTQEQLAERAGISVRGLAFLENARRRPHLSTVERLADGLGMTETERIAFCAVARNLRSPAGTLPASDGSSGRHPLPLQVVAALDQSAATEKPHACAPGVRLPTEISSLVGRQREIMAARDILGNVDVRLLTLTGPGGTGKTRLALRIARDTACERRDGVSFVALASLRDERDVPTAIIRAVGAELEPIPPRETLLAHLRSKHMLLVLDNCEHLPDLALLVREILEGCPEVKVLATSRAPLRLYGEYRFPVPPSLFPIGRRT